MKVSVIIPVYNVAPYVRACIESVQHQTFSDFEIICVDDCGTDHSMEVVRELAAKDSRIRILKNERNQGLAYSRNAGLMAARGEYVYFLDSDDMITEQALEKLCLLCDSEKLDAAIFCASFCYEDPSLESIFGGNPRIFKETYPEVLSGIELYKKWMEIWDWMPSQPRFFYRREFLEKHTIRFIDGMLHEDETFAFDVLMHAKRLRVLPDEYFIRRFRSNSIMTGHMTMKNVFGCYQILQHVTKEKLAKSRDEELGIAIDFYRGKIAKNARGKLQNVPESDRTKPALSVLIPVYNVAPYLGACIDSVLVQDIIDYEIILVDDGSTDESAEIMRKYEALDARIHCVYREQNEGQSVARNVALSMAQGDYVYMLDGDDLLTEDAFVSLMPICEKQAPDMICFENKQFADDASFAKQAKMVLFSYENLEGFYEGVDAFSTLVLEDAISPSVPTYLFKREFLETMELHFEEHILHEDIGFLYQCLLQARTVQILHKPFFLRRFRAHSTVTSGFDARHMEGYLKSWQVCLELSEQVCKKKENLEKKQGERFEQALAKWKRDVLGRIRMLYTENTENTYQQEGGFVDETTRRLFEMLKETTANYDRTEAILGKEYCEWLTETKRVYLCGMGQYTHRMIELLAPLPVVISGIVVLDKTCEAFCGYKVLTISELAEKPVEKKLEPVILSVSHYSVDNYRKALLEAGISALVDLPKAGKWEGLQNEKGNDEAAHCIEDLLLAIETPGIHVISFDLFDTLVVRPIENEADKFDLLDPLFYQETGANIHFSKLRMKAEAFLRRKIIRGELLVEDITLSDIYEVLIKQFGVKEQAAKKLYEAENKLEEELCKVRHSGKLLYERACALGKKIVLTSDMYLEKETVLKILSKNGYAHFDEIFVSSEVGLRKLTGKLFEHIVKTLQVCPDEVLHIGDSKESDIKPALDFGMNALWLPKAYNVYENSCCAKHPETICTDLLDWEKARHETGIAVFRKMAANKYFDDPFRKFEAETAYNQDPYFVGYAALGPEVFSLVKWLVANIQDKAHSKVVFLARDGYLPKLVYDEYRKLHKELPEAKYLHVSRLALLPAMIQSPMDLFDLPVDISYQTPRKLRKLLGFCDRYEGQEIPKQEANQDEVFTRESFDQFIADFIENHYDANKHQFSVERIKQYAAKTMEDCEWNKTAVFDMGYSGRIVAALKDAIGTPFSVYFFHGDGKNQFHYEKRGDLSIQAFLDFNPYMEASLREYAYLAVAPSCIGYDEKLEPVFDEGIAPGYEKTVLAMQQGALDFVKEYLDFFGAYEEQISYRFLSGAIAFEAFLRNCPVKDRCMLEGVLIDDVLWGGRRDIDLKKLMEARLRKLPEYAKKID